MTYSIFASLNQSIIFNSLAALILYSIIFSIVGSFIYSSISKACKAVKTIDSIPFMTMTELRTLAKANSIKLGRWKKVRIQNYLIEQLV